MCDTMVCAGQGSSRMHCGEGGGEVLEVRERACIAKTSFGKNFYAESPAKLYVPGKQAGTPESTDKYVNSLNLQLG